MISACCSMGTIDLGLRCLLACRMGNYDSGLRCLHARSMVTRFSVSDAYLLMLDKKASVL